MWLLPSLKAATDPIRSSGVVVPVPFGSSNQLKQTAARYRYSLQEWWELQTGERTRILQEVRFNNLMRNSHENSMCQTLKDNM